MLRTGILAFLVLSCLAGSVRAAPQPPPPVPAAADPLKPAFEALPDDQRRALQDALVWTGDFNGAVAGSYGPRTRDALLAHAKRIGLPPEAALTAAARSKLLTAAASMRGAVGFAIQRDARAGISIGLPLTLLPVRTQIPDGTRYAAPDSSAVVDTTGHAAGTGGLDDVLTRLTRDTPGRRVTYKLAKPDFIVVSGEVDDRKFYSRYAIATPAGGTATIRGFTLTYPSAVTQMDRIALAVAASFDPFPTSAADMPSQVVKAAIPPPTAALVGQAVLVGPSLALTRTDPARCRHPEVDGVAASWGRQDAGTGLALLTLPSHRDAMPVKVSASPAGASHQVLFLVQGKSDLTLSAAAAEPAGAGLIRAPLQGADAGAVLIDDAGDLSGLTRTSDRQPVSVSGVVTTARYDVVDGQHLSDFLRTASVPVTSGGTASRPGDAMVRWTGAILPLRCAAATP